MQIKLNRKQIDFDSVKSPQFLFETSGSNRNREQARDREGGIKIRGRESAWGH